MNIWTIHLGEQLTIDTNKRLFRNGMLAKAAAAMGCQVLTWAPTFSHLEKTHRIACPGIVQVERNWRLMLLDCGSYKRNVSLGRIRFHARAVKEFKQHAAKLSPPDVIYCSLPTPGMARAAVKYAKAHPNTKVVIDIRDLWPDVYITLAPPVFRGLATQIVNLFFRQNQWILNEADAITAVSNDYLNWAKNQLVPKNNKPKRVFLLGYQPQKHSITSNDPDFLLEAVNKATEADLSICYVGQFGHFYDLETVIKAVRLLEDRGTRGLSLTLCGSGAKDSKLRALAYGSLIIHFTGWIDANQISCILRTHDMGVLSYSKTATQSLPNKPFEYMAYGVGLISNLDGEMDEILKQESCGFSFKTGDVEGLAKLIKQLLNDRSLVYSARKNSERFFLEHCNANQIYEDLTSFLIEITEKS